MPISELLMSCFPGVCPLITRLQQKNIYPFSFSTRVTNPVMLSTSTIAENHGYESYCVYVLLDINIMP